MKDIIIKGARQHNLKNISVTIPRNRSLFQQLIQANRSQVSMYCLGNERQRGPGENSEFIENTTSENLRICVFWAFRRGFLDCSMNALYVCEGFFKPLVRRFPFSRSIVCW